MILITGATGLVGGHLLWHLLQTNEKVIAVKRQSSNLEPLKTIFRFYSNDIDTYLNKIEWCTADVLDLKSLLAAMANVNVVYHCAAVVSLGSGSKTLADTNVQGTRNVINACLDKKVQKLCFVSSIAACGRNDHLSPIDENGTWLDSAAKSPYSRSKYYSEQEVWRGIEKGLNAVIVNPGVILGISGNNAGSSQLFYQVQKGLMFYTSGGTGYVDVRDVVKIMIQLTNSDISGERFVLVAENKSNKEILSFMADGFGKKRPFLNVRKPILYLVGFLSELFGKLFRFEPLIDRKTARSATNKEYYSSTKIELALHYKFTNISKTIADVCAFMNQKD